MESGGLSAGDQDQTLGVSGDRFLAVGGEEAFGLELGLDLLAGEF
jgi:hypothetical protein